VEILILGLTKEKLKKSDDCIYDQFNDCSFFLLLFLKFFISDSIRSIYVKGTESGYYTMPGGLR